ncbi:serine hydrolase domain-containing protein [Benzoatithermus flavus]|uniref:Serine hydrolase n=1 Tax=Benzoatithermus flavus TaxID=3108223 RepID=A0ABU8XMV4_9PROT
MEARHLHPSRRLRRLLLGSLLLGATTASLPAPAAEPATDLPTAQPGEVGMDPLKLARLSAWLRDEKLDVRSLLVVKDDKLVFERYSGGLSRDHNYELYSVTKTVTSLLFGIVAGEGKVRPTDKVADWIMKAHPEFEQALADKQNIEMRHLMAMSSGLYYKQVEGTDPLYYTAPNRLQVALGTTARVPPEQTFEYTDVNPVLVGTAIATAAGEPEDRLAEERLFQPLQMKNYHWTGADKAGSVSGGWGLRLRAVDMAKLGLVMLHGGQWQGRQVVPKSWVEQMSAPTTKAASDYGYYCWINHIVDSEREFGAMGFKGQFITVLPEENAVVVMTSILPTEGGLRDATYINLYRKIVNDYVLPAMHTRVTPAAAAAGQEALRDELARSARSKGIPGTDLAFNDAPER